MILIADSGSTRTDWVIIDGKTKTSMAGAGLNPFFYSQKQILRELEELKLPVSRMAIEHIYFYGAGITGEDTARGMKSSFQKAFPNTRVYLEDDLVAAGRALFADGNGIACILGTGSNSGVFRDGSVKQKIPSLGFILGDEGSGADIGKRFLNGLLKNKYPSSLKSKIIEDNDLDLEDILNRVYRHSLPNRYLASLAMIVKKYSGYREMQEIITEAFNSFIENNIKRYKNCENMKIGFVGAISWHFRDILEESMLKQDLRISEILERPIDKLASYHSKRKNERQ